MSQSDCPDRQTLGQLLLGKLPGGTAEPLEEHLLHCDTCSKNAQTISESDEMMDAFASEEDFHGDEELLVQAIERAKKLHSEFDTVQAEATVIVGRREGRDEKTIDEKSIDAEEIDFLAPPEQSDEIGRLGEYRVLEVLGIGGMGVVFRVEDPKLERQIALKAMKPALAASKSDKERFLREAKATASIAHDNIVTIHQVGESRGIPFIAMQLLQGESLQAWLKREGRMDEREVLRIGREVAAGLAAAHECNLIHRDIKPDNIWIEAESGRAKILDFGLVRSTSADGGLTQTGIVLGTPRYMAPEQALGEDVDHRCDLFSLGSLLYHLASGRAPFAGGNVTALLMAVAQVDCEPLEQVCPDLRPELAGLIMQLLQKDRDQRPQSAAAVVETITNIERMPEAKRQPLAPTVRVLARRTPRFPRSRFGPVLVGGAALLLLAAIVFYVQTNYGVIRVEIDDPDIEVAIKGTEIVLKRADRGRDIKLSPGDHTLVIQRGDFRFETDKLILKRGKTVTVRVELLAGNIQVRQGEKLIGRRALPAPALAIAPFDASTAKKHQTAWADHLGVPVEKNVDIGGGVKITMVLIPPGEFLMGSSEAERETYIEEARAAKDLGSVARIPNEGPQHRVRLTKPFWLARHEVTRGQFRQFVEDTGHETDAERDGKGGFGRLDGKSVTDPRFIWNADMGFEQTDDHPVINVSWNDATAFCQWLSEKHGLMYRLPTEAQWEYACRAGTATIWYCGNSETTLKEYAWFNASSHTKTHAVGQLRPNGFGLFDMHGNVFEWCADWYGKDYYANSPTNDPIGYASGNRRYFHGGSWDHNAGQCRSALRGFRTPNSRDYALGFRVASVVVEDKGNTAQAGDASKTPEPKPYQWPANGPTPAIAPFDAAQARQHQAAWAKHLGMDIETTNSIGMKMRVIPAGEFLIGSSEQEIAKLLAEELVITKKRGVPAESWYSKGVRNERQRNVVLATPFVMGIFEVTRGQFRQFVEATGYKTDAEKDGKGGDGIKDARFVQAAGFLWNTDLGFEQTDDHPVVNVTWYDAVAFCTWLSRKEGVVYRLPTEAEWEFACRAGTTTRYSFGKDESLLNDYAWYGGNNQAEIGTKVVGRKRSNQFGLFDMHGNAVEWCHDRLGPSVDTPAVDPMGSADEVFRSCRGGEFTFNSYHLRSAFHQVYTKATRSHGTSFRIVRTFAAPKPKAATGARETDAFVLLGGDGIPERKFDTLAEAVLHASRGDIIQICGNGPFVTDPIEIPPGRPMTIRAADGFRPVIRLNPQKTPRSANLLHSDSSLVLEGLELQRLEQIPYHTDILTHTGNTSMNVANCRFLLKTSGVCVVSSASRLVLRNCEFITFSGYSFLRQTTPKNARHVLDNCVLSGNCAVVVFYANEKTPTSDYSIRLTGNTVVGNTGFGAALDSAVKTDEIVPTILVEASGNIFDNRQSIFHFFGNKSIQPQEAEIYLRRMLSWRDRWNLFRRGDSLLTFRIPEGKNSTLENNLADWKRFWGSADADVLQGDIRFRGGDFNARAKSNPEELTPEDFRLRPDSAGYRAGKDGKDLGANIDLVGPGKAYERWKKTPDYQQWLKETQELMRSDAKTDTTEKN